MEITDLIISLGLAGGLVGTAYGWWKFYHRYYLAVPPNRALVLYGGHLSSRPSSSGPSVEVRSPRIVVGGGVFVPPWRQGSDTLSLSPVECEARVLVAAQGGDSSEPPWEVRITLQVKIPVDPKMLATAAENLLGRTETEIQALVVRTVEAIAPAVIRREFSNGAEGGWDRLAAEIQAAVAPELIAVGLEVRSLSVTQVRRAMALEGSDAGTSGAPQLSLDLLRASGDLGVRLRASEVRLDRTERSLGMLGAEVMRLGRDGSQFPELPALQPYDSTETEAGTRTSTRSSRGASGKRASDAPRPLLDAEG